MPGGACRVVGIQHCLDGAGTHQRTGDAGGDALAGHVRQFLVHQLRRISAAFAHEAVVQPLLGDALKLAEQIELGFFAGIAPFGVKQTLGDVEQQSGMAQVAGVDKVQVHGFTDDARIPGD